MAKFYGADDVRRAATSGQGRMIVEPDFILSPLARDVAREMNVDVVVAAEPGKRSSAPRPPASSGPHHAFGGQDAAGYGPPGKDPRGEDPSALEEIVRRVVASVEQSSGAGLPEPATTRARRLLAGSGTVIAPGVHDALSARIADEIGFPLLYVTGGGLEATVLGKPDIGLSTMRDVVYTAGNIAGSVRAPVFCDAETGFGGATNVWHTVQEFERSGVAGIHIEDQELPKKCGLLTGRRLVSQESMVGKIEAALDARRDPDFLIIARTDAYTDRGVDEAVRRYNSYLDAGADLLLLAETYSSEDMQTIVGRVNGPVAICAGLPGQPAHLLSTRQYADMGVKLVLFPVAAVLACVRTLVDVYTQMKEHGQITPAFADQHMVTMEDMFSYLEFDLWAAREEKFERGR